MSNLFRHAASVSALTLVSRVLGVVRDGVIAAVFGTSLMSDVFFLAFRPFDLVRKLFSEGILSLSLIPLFSGYLVRGQEDQVRSMFWSGLVCLSLGSAALAVIAMVAAPVLVGMLAPGFPQDGVAHALTIQLLRVMLPYLCIILILALCMAVLNALGQFKGPAATPVFLNVSIILSVWLLTPEPRVLAPAVGVILGGLVQLGVQVPFLLRAGMARPGRVLWVHPGLVRAGKRFFPSMIGASAFQVNVLVSALLATTLAEGSISHLYFAERLVQFPVALLVSSAATVFLPTLSGAAAAGKVPREIPGFEAGARVVLFFTIAAMAGIMALDRHIVELLFGRGAFDAGAVAQTADCLFFLAAGLWAMAGTRLYVTCHFAVEDFRLPAIASGVSLGVHLLAALLLRGSMGTPGLALALALGALAGFLVMGAFSRVGPAFSGLLVSACRGLFVSGIMACLVRWAAGWMIPVQGTTLYRGTMLALVIGLGVMGFLAVAAWAARPEMNTVKQVLTKHHVRD